METLREVLVPSLPLARLRPLIGEERFERLEDGAVRTRELVDGGVVWNVNSTASCGGVAEMLQVIVGYGRGAGLDVRWLVAKGDAAFFGITKRIHNQIHGMPGDGGPLGASEHARFEAISARNAAALVDLVRAGDVVILHDPQTAGLCEPLQARGVHTVWRCHIGSDVTNHWTEQAWSFLLPYVKGADAFVFSRHEYVPAGIPREQVFVIPPSIDPFSPKNRELTPDTVERILRTIGLHAGGEGGPLATFERADGTRGRVRHRAMVVGDALADPSLPLVVQVSRWDRLKDMHGVMLGFAEATVGRVDANLALVGPSVDGVADDPEGAAVLHECIDAWHSLDPSRRAHIRLVSLPMSDIEENAIMVNAVQRAATVVVQKSIAEGFGLTVAEAMWKAKPVVASAVGGIVDQLTPDTGVLLDDPHDLTAFGHRVAGLLVDPERLARLGRNAQARVRDDFVGDRHLLQYGTLLASLLGRRR